MRLAPISSCRVFSMILTRPTRVTRSTSWPAFGATYVDFYSVINGNVDTLTNHQVPGGGHANQAGYDALALALEGAVVPEPASVVMLAIGLAGTLGYGWRRRRVITA
jgi:hypothetical protein